jgi:hypothetical protein
MSESVIYDERCKKWEREGGVAHESFEGNFSSQLFWSRRRCLR